MNKDQGYGFAIFILSIIVAVVYLAAFFSPFIPGLQSSGWQQWAIGIPVLLFVLLVLVISGWIGWTMLTTPPPAPLEPETVSPPSPEPSSESSTHSSKPRRRRRASK
jgi:protein-S-isoprenylcysteine O-methyltransferase Ste14